MSAACVVPATIAHEIHGEWIASSAAFARLGAEWSGLFQRANQDNVFLTFEWMSTWWKHFGKGQLAVIAVRDETGRLVAVAPFYIARSLAGVGARRLGFLADEHVGSDYLNILADPAFEDLAVHEIVRTLFAHQRLWDYIELRDTAESPLAAAFSVRLESRGLCASHATRRVCHYIPLPPTFEKFLAGLSTSLRCNYKRRWRILQREHQAECLTVSSAAGIERHFPSLIALHRMRFEQRSEESAFLAPGVPEFHAEAMRALASQGMARLILLQAGGETVSAIYGFSVGKTFQFYQCGMHTGWMRQGVGQVLIGHAIEQALTAGHTTFDFLRGDESYKTQWAEQWREIVTLRFFDHRPASVMAHGRLRATAAVRGAARQFRALIRSRAGRLISPPHPEKLSA